MLLENKSTPEKVKEVFPNQNQMHGYTGLSAPLSVAIKISSLHLYY